MSKSISILALLCILVFSCTPSKNANNSTTEVNKQEASENFDRIMVLLKNQISPEVLTTSFAAYKLENQGQTSRTENRFIFGYDRNKVKAKKILSEIRAHQAVEEAMFAPIK